MKKVFQVVGLSLLIVSFLLSPLYAINPTAKYFGNTKGINQKLTPILIDDAECADCQNVYFDEASIIKRLGYNKLNTTTITNSPDVTGLYDFALVGGTRVFVCCTSDGKTWKMDGLDGTWDDITNAGGALTADARWTFTTFLDSAGNTISIMMNGTDVPQYWNGAAANTADLQDTGVGNAPVNQYQIVFKNRLFAAGNSTYPNRLYYTDTNDGNDWTTGGGTIEINSNDGDEITGLIATKYAGTDIYDKLVIFKKNSIFMLDADDALPANWLVSKIHETTGCVSAWSLQNAENVIIFLAANGIYTLEGTVVTQISDRIDPIIRDLNPARLDEAVSILYLEYDQYWLSVSDGGSDEHDIILVYDYLIESWTKYTGILSNAFAQVMDPTTEDRRIYSGDYNGFVFRQWIGNNDGVSVGTTTGTAESATNNTITDDDAAFTVVGSGLMGCVVTIRSGTGIGQTRTISSNTATQLTVSAVWTTNPDASSVYGVGDINAYYTTKTYTFNSIEWLKRIMYFYVYAYASGAWNVVIGYSRDGLTTYAETDLSLDAGGSLWNSMIWSTSSWGGEDFIRTRFDLGEVCWGIRLKFTNNYEAQPFKIYGWSFNIQPLQKDTY